MSQKPKSEWMSIAKAAKHFDIDRDRLGAAAKRHTQSRGRSTVFVIEAASFEIRRTVADGKQVRMIEDKRCRVCDVIVTANRYRLLKGTVFCVACHHKGFKEADANVLEIMREEKIL